MAIRMVNLTCLKCGMSLDCDVSSLQSFCPECGAPLLVTVTQLMDILDEKKELKRKDIKYEKDVTVRPPDEKKKKKVHWDHIAVILALILFAAVIVLLCCKRFL